MRTRLASYALAGALGLTGVAGAALLAPAVSYAVPSAVTGDSSAISDRVTSLRQALAGLVSDGTLTSAQADRVATTLAETLPRRGPRGGHVDLAAAAKALGMTEDELRTAAQEGTTLAELAKQEGVATDTLVDALVAAGRARLAQAVEDGRMTQAHADEHAATLEERITAALDRPLRGGPGSGHGPGGHRGGHGSTGEAPSSSPSTTPSTSS